MLLIGLLPSQRAFADVRTEARSHFRNGMSLIQEGRLDEGVRELETAYDLLPHPNVLYNIARAYAEAGAYEEAVDYYGRYLDTDPPDREDVQAFIKALQSRMAQREETKRESEGKKVEQKIATQAAPAAPQASAEEIQALEDSATQIQTLAEATQSESLRQRAERLRALAQALRERPQATGTATQSPTETASAGGKTSPGEAMPLPQTKLELGQARGEDVYEERVVSASRFAQSPLDAPNSTATITRQDIRLSGLTHIGELMRRVAGADVMTTSPADVQLSMRGFNDRLNQRMLVLVDGRSTYLDYIGTTFMSRLPFNVEDIERVEVIRGPASALYGANAYSGVVNIITRAPGEPETTAVAGFGNKGQGHGHLAASGRVQRKLAYRVSAGYNRANVFERAYDPRRADLIKFVDDPNLSYQNFHTNGTLRYRLHKNVQASVQGGVADNYSEYTARGPRGSFIGKGVTSHVMGLIESSWGQIRTFWNRASEDGSLPLGVQGTDSFESKSVSNVFDIDGTLSRQFKLVVDHNLHLGAWYRQKRIAWNYLDGDHKENHYAVYAQDTIAVTQWLTLVGSFRADWHPLLKTPPLSPRGAIILKPTQQQAIRMSAGTAFRTPTFVETYFRFRNPTAPALFVETAGIQNAGLSIKPERIVSYELGYMNMMSEYFKAEANVYYNKISDLIVPITASAITPGQFLDPNVQGYSLADNSFPLALGLQTNERAKYDQVGGEVMGTFYPVSGVDLYANFAETKIFGPAGDTRGPQTSRHKFNIGAQYRSTFGFDANADLHVASKTQWALPTPDFQGTQILEVPTYYMINGRLGYRFYEDKLELGLVGYNITGNRMRQHPFGQRLDSRVMLTAAMRL